MEKNNDIQERTCPHCKKRFRLSSEDMDTHVELCEIQKDEQAGNHILIFRPDQPQGFQQFR